MFSDKKHLSIDNTFQTFQSLQKPKYNEYLMIENK